MSSTTEDSLTAEAFMVAMRLIAVAQSVNAGNAPNDIDVLDQYDEAFYRTALPAFGDITYANCTALVSAILTVAN